MNKLIKSIFRRFSICQALNPRGHFQAFNILAVLTTSMTATIAIADQPKTCVPSTDRCDFYDCAESQFKCGDDGYFLKTAKKYCSYDQLTNRADVSPALKKMAPALRECLQKEVLQFSRGWSCDTVKEVALDSHVACLVESGFCDLTMSDIRMLSAQMNDLGAVTSTYGTLSLGLAVINACATQKLQIQNQGAYFGATTTAQPRQDQRNAKEILSSLRPGEAYWIENRLTPNKDHQQPYVIPYFFESYLNPLVSEEVASARKIRNERRRDQWIRSFR